MRQLIAFIQKEFYHIFRDRRTLLILLGMPICLMFIFGYALNTEIKNAKIAILDEDKDQHSIQITNKILSSGYFNLYQNLHSHQEIEPAFRDGKVKLAIVFPLGFTASYNHNGKAQIQLIGDATDPNTAATLIVYAGSIIRDYQIEQAKILNLPMNINTTFSMYYNPTLKSAFSFVPGVLVLVLMLISAMMTSITLAREKEFGNMEILLVSPLRPYQIIFGKVIPYFLLSIFNAGVLLFLGIVLFKIPMLGSWFLLSTVCLLFITTALSLGILISTTANSQIEAMFSSAVSLLMPTMLLTGFIFPLESMPYILQLVSNAIPATWFMAIIKNIMLKGAGIELVWKPTLILLGMTIFFMALSIKNFKNKLT